MSGQRAPGPASVHIRPARDADAQAVIALIEACFAEYPGCVMDLAGLDSDLPKVASHFRAQGGHFWIAEQGGGIVGCAGYMPVSEGTIELKRLYIAAHARRQGLGSRLLGLVCEAARGVGAERIHLWSDTRFAAAHAFYLAHGFKPTGETRQLHDPSNTTEYAFARALG